MLKYLAKRPMLISALGCSVLSFISFYDVNTAVGLIPFVGAAFVIFILKKTKAEIAVCVLIILIANIAAVLEAQKAERENRFQNQVTSCTFVVLKSEYWSAGLDITTVEVLDSTVLKKGTKISAYHEPTELECGDIFKADITVKPLKQMNKAANYGKGIYISANMRNIEKTGDSDFLLKSAEDIRTYIRNTVFKNLGYKESATVVAMLYGEKGYFSDGFSVKIKNAGLSHVMVVSGMHLSVIVLMAQTFLKNFLNSKWVKVPVILAVTLFVTVICGFTMSVIRAGATCFIVAAALLLNRNHSPVNSLGTAVSFILIISPFAIFSIGFRLSVLATLGILTVALPVLNFINETKSVLSKPVFKPLLYIVTTLLVTVSATILTAPVIIFSFGGISVVGIFANLCVSFALPWLLILSVAGLIINLVSPLFASVIFRGVEVLAKYINFVIEYWGSKSFAAINLPKSSAFIAMLLIFAVFYCLIACKNRMDMLKLRALKKKIDGEGRKRKNGFIVGK